MKKAVNKEEEDRISILYLLNTTRKIKTGPLPVAMDLFYFAADSSKNF